MDFENLIDRGSASVGTRGQPGLQIEFGMAGKPSASATRIEGHADRLIKPVSTFGANRQMDDLANPRREEMIMDTPDLIDLGRASAETRGYPGLYVEFAYNGMPFGISAED